jgi:hypothetical protein
MGADSRIVNAPEAFLEAICGRRELAKDSIQDERGHE